MSDFNYSGYPLRASVPYGYSFVQYVSIFRDSGGYGSLRPRESASTPTAAPVEEKADKPGMRIAKGANKLSMPGNGKALGHVHSNGNGRDAGEAVADIQAKETGKFDAVEGNAEAEFKWRDTPQRG